MLAHPHLGGLSGIVVQVLEVGADGEQHRPGAWEAHQGLALAPRVQPMARVFGRDRLLLGPLLHASPHVRCTTLSMWLGMADEWLEPCMWGMFNARVCNTSTPMPTHTHTPLLCGTQIFGVQQADNSDIFY